MHHQMIINITIILYLPQNKQVRLFEGHNLTLGFLETPYLSKVPQQVTHESGWGSKVNIERKSQIKQKKDQLCEIS